MIEHNLNNVFVLSSNLDRIEYFIKYYNVLNKTTKTSLNLIIDDRNIDKTDKRISELKFDNVYFVKDIIEQTKDFFSGPALDFYDEILDKYRVSIKWLIFIYTNKVLNLKQSALLDDDTFLLQPIDHYFENKNVIFREQLSAMNDNVKTLLSNICGDIVDIRKLAENRNYLNSGQMIYTWESDVLLDFMNKVFCQDMLNFINEGIAKYSKSNTFRKVGGFYWIIEQYIYAVFFEHLKTKTEVVNFKNDICLHTYTKFKNTKIKKLPCYIHFLPKDKSPLYEIYTLMVDDYLENYLKNEGK